MKDIVAALALVCALVGCSAQPEGVPGQPGSPESPASAAPTSGTSIAAETTVAPDTTTTQAEPGERERVGWEVIGRARLNVNGWGDRELVIVRKSQRVDDPQIAIHFPDGHVEASTVQGRFWNGRIMSSPVDPHPGEELLVTDPISYTVSIWAYRDRTWRRLDLVHPPAFRESIGPDEHGYGVLTRSDELVSWRSVEPFDVGYDTAFAPSPVYEVDTWTWRFARGRVRARPDGRRCMSQDIGDRLITCP